MQFEEFMGSLTRTNCTLSSFVDFEKVSQNVEQISIHLNQLNYLIGKQRLEEAVKKLYEVNPACFSVLNILIAVRRNREVIDREGNVVFLNNYFSDYNKAYEFIVETGLSDVLRNENVKNLVDYVFGIEVGLDTNARKNRGGKNMEKLVAAIFSRNQIPFKTEVSSRAFHELQSLGEDTKIFDFAIETRLRTYLIETNYFHGGGSKLSETARSYRDLAIKINAYPEFEFVWITDGQGWCSARSNLEEAFTAIPRLYNLASLKEFIETLRDEL